MNLTEIKDCGRVQDWPKRVIGRREIPVIIRIVSVSVMNCFIAYSIFI